MYQPHIRLEHKYMQLESDLSASCSCSLGFSPSPLAYCPQLQESLKVWSNREHERLQPINCGLLPGLHIPVSHCILNLGMLRFEFFHRFAVHIFLHAAVRMPRVGGEECKANREIRQPEHHAPSSDHHEHHRVREHAQKVECLAGDEIHMFLPGYQRNRVRKGDRGRRVQRGAGGVGSDFCFIFLHVYAYLVEGVIR